MKKVRIYKGTIDEAIRVSDKIPEFTPSPGRTEYEKRLAAREHLILIARMDDELAGFKVGYREQDYFYSWLGGVIPGFRNQNVARSLAEAQEEWVARQGISKIRFKTQNKFRAMLIFAIKNGFHIVGTVKFDGDEGFKIILDKTIR